MHQNDGLCRAPQPKRDEFTKSLVFATVNKFRSAGLDATIAFFTGPESAFSGLSVTIDYYNTAETVEGEWFAFIADGSRGLMRPDPETAAASCPRGGYRSVMSTPPSPGSRTARSSRGCPVLTCRETRAVRRHLYAEASG